MLANRNIDHTRYASRSAHEDEVQWRTTQKGVANERANMQAHVINRAQSKTGKVTHEDTLNTHGSLWYIQWFGILEH